MLKLDAMRSARAAPAFSLSLRSQVFQSLAQFNEHVCNEIINKFLESDLTRVSNKSGWLIGIIKRFRNNGAVAHPSNAAVCVGGCCPFFALMCSGIHACFSCSKAAF